MQITVASYNIRKAIGLDRRRDPDRILAILREMDADVIAMQEVDMRFGRRMSVLPLEAIHQAGYKPVPLSMKPDSLGWHGNALLIRRAAPTPAAARVRLQPARSRGVSTGR